MKCNKTSIVVVLLVLAFCTGATAQDWKNCYDYPGIKISYISDTVKNVYKVRVSSLSSITMNELYKRLLDVKKYPDYVTNCIYAETLKKYSDSCFIYYTITELPFPLKKRDIVVKLTSKKSAGAFTIVTEVFNNFLEEKQGYDRVKGYKAIWFVEETNAGLEIKLSMELSVPQIVPAWLRYQIIVKGPVETYLRFTHH
ncbi:MAG: hypothetical protein KBB11_06815 [Bacteroidales bacterium]|nr:hypothetical protein [Bacteroidales bacterium]HOY38009.1 START domain-containing protein [Bacteroidales bacterium]HQP04309.1 START domain-containing protein [Bacteroidales bacterium]